MAGGLKVQVIVQYMRKMGTDKYHNLMVCWLCSLSIMILCFVEINEGLLVDSRNLNC